MQVIQSVLDMQIKTFEQAPNSKQLQLPHRNNILPSLCCDMLDRMQVLYYCQPREGKHDCKPDSASIQ